MAKRKGKLVKTATPPSRKKVEETKNLNVWIPASLRDALEIVTERSRRSLTAEVIVALEKYLRDEGVWPLASDTDEED
jgi:hypothetical protein